MAGKKRGALIILEGLDRSGKSTQCDLLIKWLKEQQIAVSNFKFPARESNIGSVINSYLKNEQELSDEVIHLLFSANRWEFKQDMKTQLEAGTTLVVDRYSYSGVAYSVAKGLPFEWCMAPERRLIQPDAVFYLRTPVEQLTDRVNYGDERYEKIEFQKKVAQVFDRLSVQEHNYWTKFDASLSRECISREIHNKALQVIHDVEDKPLVLFK